MKNALDYVGDWLGFMLVCRSPDWLFNYATNADHWLGNWALPRAGSWANREVELLK
jgi:hypothetical protein